MENNDTKKSLIWTVVTVLVVAAVVGLVFFLPKNTSQLPYKNLDAFAKCLTDKGAVMYGAYWCSHCKAQKEAFGQSFQYVNYVECTEKPDVCNAAGVESYPTWKIASTTLVGEISLEDLAVDSGCVLEPR